MSDVQGAVAREPDNTGDGDRWEDPRDTLGGYDHPAAPPPAPGGPLPTGTPVYVRPADDPNAPWRYLGTVINEETP